MTAEVREKIWTELGKAGALFLVMGVIIFFLYLNWSKQQEQISQNQIEMRLEIKALRQETKECSNEYKNLLVMQIEKNNSELENTRTTLEKIQDFFNLKRRR